MTAKNKKPDMLAQGRGIIPLSSQFLRDVLQLPRSYHVLGAHFDAMRDCWLIGVEHPLIPVTKELDSLPTVTPIYQAEQKEDGQTWRRLVDIQIEGRDDDLPDAEGGVHDANTN